MDRTGAEDSSSESSMVIGSVCELKGTGVRFVGCVCLGRDLRGLGRGGETTTIGGEGRGGGGRA